MRYSLEKDANGRITQCDNGDGNNNVWSKRKELNKLAIENLARPTPGKLGGLANLQIFNLQLDPLATGVADNYFAEYNTTADFPSNMTQTFMFGTDNTTDQGLYFNIVDIKASLYTTLAISSDLLEDSFIEFYILQNIPGFTGSSGTKIPAPASSIGVGGGSVDYTSGGAQQGNQYLKINLTGDNVNIPSTLNGLRCSGLALKTINLAFSTSENLDGVRINFQIFVDNTSVSTTY